MLLDAYGQPFPAQGQMKQAQTARVARFARPWHDSALRGLKPAAAAKLLADADAGHLPAQALLFADMLDRDAVITAALEQRTLAVARLHWVVTAPAKASALEQRAVEGVTEMIHGGIDALEDVIVALMDAVGFGYSAVEIVWKRVGGQWLPDLYPRPHTWLTSSEDGRALHLEVLGGSEPLRPLSWITHQPKTARAGYQSRGGVFRALVWPFIYKAYAVGDFAEFLETFGLPFVIGKYGREATEDDKSRLLAAVAALAHDARAIMPLEMQLEVQRVAASGTDSPHLAMVRWADEAIARAILGQTLSSQVRSTGLGSGVADLQAEVRHDLRDADARQLAATLSRDLIWPIAALNFGLTDPRRSPRLVFDVSQTDDLKTYADAIPALAAAGVTIPVSWVRQRLGIPEPVPDEALVGETGMAARRAQPTPLSTRPPVAPDCDCAACTVRTGDYSTPEDDPTPVARMTAQMDTEGAQAFTGIMHDIQRLVATAQSLDQLRTALLAAYGDLATADLADVMALGFAAAHLAGRLEAEQDGFDAQRG